MQPFVVVVEDTRTGACVERRFDRSPVRIGSATVADLVLDDPDVAIWHGVLEFDDRAARYVDLGSAGGTLVDGAPAPPRTPMPLGKGGTISIGALRVRVPPREGGESPTPSIRPGSITELMRRLAAAPQVEADAEWQRALYPGAVVGRFELVREIGRGSFGRVFEALDTKLDRLVAFKAVLPGRESQMRLRRERLEQEAEAVAQLHHPNIVTLFDSGTDSCGPYLIFELLEGETLHERLRRGRLPVDDALDVAIAVARALAHAHRAGLCHRDLKPANVFLGSEGAVKVLDFGIAHVFGGGIPRLFGTPAYMAPEQWRQSRQDARTDVFSAAATLFESIAGRLPYEVTATSSAALEPGATPHVSDPTLPVELKVLLRRALAVDPASRPEDGKAWLEALLEIREHLDAHPPTRARRDASRARRAASWLGLAAAAAAALAAGAYALLRH